MSLQEIVYISAGLGTLFGAATAAFMVYWRASHAERKAEKGDTELDKKISFLEGRLFEQNTQNKDLRSELNDLKAERITWQAERSKLIDLWKLERARADKLQEQVNVQAGQINQLNQDISALRVIRPIYETK